MQKNFGLIQEKQISPKDYVFGGVSAAGREVLSEDGDYSDHLPDHEGQSGIYFGTQACVTFSALNCLEIAYRALGWGEVDFSDRFTAKMSDTSRSGNTFRRVAESIRKHGVVPDELWDWNPDQRNPVYVWEDFYQEIPQEIKMKALQWLQNFKPRWEWVHTSPESFKRALPFGPLQVTVLATNTGEDTIVQDPSNKYRNHAPVIYGYEDGEYWKVMDSLRGYKKKFAWDYDFGAALRYSIEKINKEPTKPMSIENNKLVQQTGDGASGEFGLHLDGEIIVGDPAEILATYMVRKEGTGISKEEWDKFDKKDLKGNPI